MSAPDYAAWDLVNAFTIAQAAALWINIEPECDSVADDACSPKVRALAREIGEKLRVGDLRDYHHPARGRGGFIGYDRVEHHYTERKVTRTALLSLANQKSERPLFLFRDDRQQPEATSAPEPAAVVQIGDNEPETPAAAKRQPASKATPKKPAELSPREEPSALDILAAVIEAKYGTGTVAKLKQNRSDMTSVIARDVNKYFPKMVQDTITKYLKRLPDL
ncbi:hypothetical protein [uncultured Lamprocystis sp.]|uniref:hypothetical protein n=1 Tax=uncultured Lamprocystis sp. TaxID=543132 RepID=UPI0025F6A7BF|nr:hypothetical protein [uncultured Lamprocystis sp.]